MWRLVPPAPARHTPMATTQRRSPKELFSSVSRYNALLISETNKFSRQTDRRLDPPTRLGPCVPLGPAPPDANKGRHALTPSTVLLVNVRPLLPFCLGPLADRLLLPGVRRRPFWPHAAPTASVGLPLTVRYLGRLPRPPFTSRHLRLRLKLIPVTYD